MFLLSFLFVYQLNPLNIEEMEEISMKKPVFIYFLIPTCPDCRPFNPLWREIVDQYDNDKYNNTVVLVEANCRMFFELRQKFGITWVPSFMSIYKKQRTLEEVVSTFESLNNVVQNLLLYKTNRKFHEFSKLTAKYPAFVVGNKDNDSHMQIIKYQTRYPRFKDNFYYINSNDTKGFIYLDRDRKISFEGNIYSPYFEKFIHEFTFDSLGNWKINETKDVKRRLCFFVYSIDGQLGSLDSLVKKYDERFVFGKILLTEFNTYYPSIRLSSRSLPGLAVTNKKRTKFVILSSKRSFYSMLTTIEGGRAERLMDKSLKPIFPDIKNEYGSVPYFAFAALLVIALTAFVIIRRANECIMLNGNTKRRVPLI